jgi:hypothetical protein
METKIPTGFLQQHQEANQQGVAVVPWIIITFLQIGIGGQHPIGTGLEDLLGKGIQRPGGLFRAEIETAFSSLE